ncbi:MAG: carbohydrate ABC transporter permease [Litorilinea sp.]
MASQVSISKPPVAPQPKVRRPNPLGRISGMVLIYAVLIIGAILALVPFVYTVSVSLMNLTEASGGRWLPITPQWGNYEQAWNEAQFSRYFMNSVKLTAITVSGEMIFCTLAAYAFARMEFPGKNFLFAALLSTLMLPEAVTWVPNFITVSWLGRVGPIPWMNNWPALTIPFMAGAFSIFLLRQFFLQIPKELWDSAQIDGAGHLRYLTRIMIPLSKAPMMTVILFSFIGSWNALAWPILVTTTPDWRPISYGLLTFLDEAGSFFHLQMAGSIITMAPILLVFFFTQRQFIEGIATSGLKG